MSDQETKERVDKGLVHPESRAESESDPLFTPAEVEKITTFDDLEQLVR
jgi:hypothetical protein